MFFKSTILCKWFPRIMCNQKAEANDSKIKNVDGKQGRRLNQENFWEKYEFY